MQTQLINVTLSNGTRVIDLVSVTSLLKIVAAGGISVSQTYIGGPVSPWGHM